VQFLTVIHLADSRLSLSAQLSRARKAGAGGRGWLARIGVLLTWLVRHGVRGRGHAVDDFDQFIQAIPVMAGEKDEFVGLL